MRFPGFIGPSYTLSSRNADCQRTVNLYPELNELGTGKEREVATLLGTPGLRLLLSFDSGPIRALHTASNGTLYVVANNKIYSVSEQFEETELGTLLTSSGPVSMADNGIHLVAVDGDNGYQVTMDSATFTQITDEDFNGADQVTYQDGYFIFNWPGTQKFYFTGLNDTAIDGLDFGSASGSPDQLVGLISDRQNLYLFGDSSTEVFYNSGGADDPFIRTQGALIGVGCEAAHSIAEFEGTIFWLGKNRNGRGIVYQAQGYQPKRISTHAIEAVIRGLGDVSEARAWTYQQAGHPFYCLNLPGATSTWVYDLSTGLWHERAFMKLGQFERHKADCHAFAYSLNVVGDYSEGKLYALDSETYTDNGDPLVWERAVPHVSRDGKLIFHSELTVDVEAGVGIATGQGSSPTIALQWSDDGGHTWSSEREASIGAMGSRKVRAKFSRLGSSRDRVYRARGSDPVKRVILGADIVVEEGVS